MRIAIFDDDYPDAENLPGDMFVHVRTKLYLTRASVLVLRRSNQSRQLEFEGVNIRDYRTRDEVLELLREYSPDVAAVHFATEPFISEVSPLVSCPLYVWVHGFEAMAWHRRSFNMALSDWMPNRLLFRHQRSRERLRSFSKLIDRSNAGATIQFVFVSEWMKRVCEADTSRTVQHSHIVPNPIDTLRFTRNPFTPRRKHLLVIRSSRTMGYCPDIVSQVVRDIVLKDSEFSCRIFSDGIHFDKYIAPLDSLRGVEVTRGFLTQDEIVEQHKWGGFFLCPTRQDSHGVSMCEAMASGLIVATRPVTAIPEFARSEFAILRSSADELAREILEISNDLERASNMSAAAADHIAATLNASDIVERELTLMRQHVETAA